MGPINELEPGDVYVADASARSSKGTLIGSNLGSGIAAHSWTGFVLTQVFAMLRTIKKLPI